MPRAVIVAILVVLAVPLGVAGVPSGSGSPGHSATSLDDIAILTLGEDSRASFATPSMDIATAMTVQREAADERLDRYALERRIDRTESIEARQTLLFEAATAVEIRIASLRDQERSLRTAYANRDLTTETFVRRLVGIHARVALLRGTLETIGGEADAIPEFSLRGRLRLLDAALFGLDGPVREHALASLRGDQPPERLFVQASEQGVVLATINDGQFVRETHRANNRDTETVSGISLSEAAERTSELYPVAYNGSVSIRTGINGLSGGLFRIDIELREGFITAYLDGATGDVFFEVQERRLNELGPRPSVTGVANGTRLEVARAYAGGPLEISVTDNATGEPIQTTVYVEDSRVETQGDGSVWTLAPAFATYQVTAVRPQGNVTVSVRPLPVNPVNGEG